MDLDVFLLQADRPARAGADHGVDQRGGHVHVGDRIAELILLGPLHLDRALADHRTLVPAGARGFEVGEDLFQQLALKQAISFGSELVAFRPALQALLLGHVAHHLFDLFLQLVELVHFARLGKLRQLFQVDHADLRRLGRLLELLQQPVDRFELFLDLQSLRHRERRVTGKLVLAGQFVHLILLSQRGHQLHQLPGKRRAVVARLIPQPLQVANLLVAHRLLVALPQVARRLDTLGGVAVLVLGQPADLFGLVLFQDLPLPFLEHRLERFDAGSQPGDLAGVELDGPGQLLFGQLAHTAVGQQVLERRRNQVGRRLRGTRQVLGIELLIGVNHTAELTGIGHGLFFSPSH